MATVRYGNHELDYDEVMDAYDSIKNGSEPDTCILISGVPMPVEVPVKDLYAIVKGITNGTADIDYTPVRLRHSIDSSFISAMVDTKEEMGYVDLCTLEELLSYFNHDTELDMEIAKLKEKCLLKEIDTLERRLNKATGGN